MISTRVYCRVTYCTSLLIDLKPELGKSGDETAMETPVVVVQGCGQRRQISNKRDNTCAKKKKRIREEKNGR